MRKSEEDLPTLNNSPAYIDFRSNLQMTKNKLNEETQITQETNGEKTLIENKETQELPEIEFSEDEEIEFFEEIEFTQEEEPPVLVKDEEQKSSDYKYGLPISDIESVDIIEFSFEEKKKEKKKQYISPPIERDKQEDLRLEFKDKIEKRKAEIQEESKRNKIGIVDTSLIDKDDETFGDIFMANINSSISEEEIKEAMKEPLTKTNDKIKIAITPPRDYQKKMNISEFNRGNIDFENAPELDSTNAFLIEDTNIDEVDGFTKAAMKASNFFNKLKR